MHQDFRSSPIVVMMGVRYSNGITMTYAARALDIDSQSIRVVMAEDLDDGIHVNLSAPFLKGVAPCYLASRSRAAEWPGYILMELRFYEPLEGVAMSDVRNRSGSGLLLERIDIGVACHDLADLLENGSTFGFARIIQSSPPKQRLLYCALSALAAMIQLQEEYFFDFRGLIDTLPKSASLMGEQGNLR